MNLFLARLCLLSKMCIHHLAKHSPKRLQLQAAEPGISFWTDTRWCSDVRKSWQWGRRAEPAAPCAARPASTAGEQRSALQTEQRSVSVPRTGRAETEVRQCTRCEV